MLKTPPLQTATATIETLCSRLQSATLLEDRRSSILGLRSFAKQYPASVASGSLRELIATLKKDGLGQNSDGQRGEEGSGDVDTIRLILETLLMLFKPDENSLEADDEIAFFLADEFSMRQDNVSMLLNLLDPTSPYADYYSRLYSIQILSAICASRPARLQECILSAPLGVSRLVGILDDARDAIRNAGLLLLVDLTGGANEDLRKIVAFEDVFAKVFALIQLEGGLAEAGITAQDCLSLLANLIGGSASNQTMFRESGCVGQLCRLLTELFPPQDAAEEASFLAQNREKAGWGLLQLLRLFLTPGEPSTPQNQQAFFRTGAAQILIDLAFVNALPSPMRLAALRCAADLVQNNHPLQEQFAALTVVTSVDAPPAPPSIPSRSQTPAQANGVHSAKGSARPSADQPRVYIIEGLLDMALSTKLTFEVSLRASACALIQAYLTGHDRIKAHFLQRAIAGHIEQEDAANVLTSLLHSVADPTSIVFSSWIVQDIVADSVEAKAAFASVKEGNEDEGEDVISAIQAIGSQLHASLQLGPVNERVAVSLASMLITLLWDFVEGIDDLLAEGSGLVQSLMLTARSAPSPPVAGFAAALLGVIYEFSTKDSPISRRTIAPLLTQKLGRNKYLDALLSLRRDPSLRDFGLDEVDDAEGVLCATSVDLFLNEYSRLKKAIDKDPGIEVLPTSAAEAGVDRDILDSLRQEAQASKDALAQATDERQAAIQAAEQEKLGREKELQTLATQVETLRKSKAKQR
ncbi:hypothetical protein K431DRAFT_62664 [Polychaeton citri CBS 116435]|uniref:Vesicle tethering protein Uso1/P115-like head domain-containing protein n=1 Tax=Polychaeton citri CBS 116435 TaxID=1314669 RepID=A0A9P4UN44_9PEZI|nr:hypothetical protein K431DRAFT_62664 [Polychaeton citri CBS 116435]